MRDISVVGLGVVGTAIATVLKKRGYNLTGIASRSLDKAQKIASTLDCPFTVQAEKITIDSQIVFITTSDSAISEVISNLVSRGGIKAGQTVVHMSGALPSSVLLPAKEVDALIVSIHPLQSFASIDMAINNLPGSFFTIEGDPATYPWAETLVKDLAGQSFYIAENDKALYHAAACVASNFLVALLDYSVKIFSLIGIPEEKGISALMPLIQGSVNNVNNLGPAKALTGPISRGDLATVKKHLVNLQDKKPDFLDLYRQLGLYTTDVALTKKSINCQQAEGLIKLLKEGF